MILICASHSTGRAVAQGTDSVPADSLVDYVDITTWDLVPPVANSIVISSRVRWASLWRLYSRERWIAVESLPPDVPHINPRFPSPEIDFGRDQVVMVYLGELTGCGPSQPIISRVERRGGRRLVLVHRPSWGEMGPCNMTGPVGQFIRLVREPTPISIVDDSTGRASQLPSEGTWWPTATIADVFDTTRTAEAAMRRNVARRTILTDPATPESLLAAVGKRAAAIGDDDAVVWLLSNPRTPQSARILGAIAASDSVYTGWGNKRIEAQRLLLQRHGLRLAANPATPPLWLARLIDEVQRREGAEFPPDTLARQVGALLIGNSTVTANRAMLRSLARAIQREPDLLERACRTYLSKWELEEVLTRDSAGRPYSTIQAPCWDFVPRAPAPHDSARTRGRE